MTTYTVLASGVAIGTATIDSVRIRLSLAQTDPYDLANIYDWSSIQLKAVLLGKLRDLGHVKVELREVQI